MMTLPPVLLGIHAVLLAVVAVTDLTRRTVYRAWTVSALLTGLVTAVLAPLPWQNLTLGIALFALGYWKWRQHNQGQGDLFGGGDVWVLTYLGLTFGPALLGPLVLSSLLVFLALVLRLLRWQGTMPAAALWALGALLWLGVSLTGAPDRLVTQLTVPAPAHTFLVSVSPLSPLATPTPDLTARALSDQAAAQVALVGLTAEEQRPAQAQRAAVTLRALAEESPQPEQVALLQRWAEALERYAAGDKSVLPLIQQLSGENQQSY